MSSFLMKPWCPHTGWKTVQTVRSNDDYSAGPPLVNFSEDKTTQSHHHLVPSDQYARDFGMRGTGSHKDHYSTLSLLKGKARTA